MSDHSTIVTKKILETYKGFEGLETVVDVGDGAGTLLNMIISKYPNTKGISFDLPHWVFHNWSEEHCLKFLNNCHEALPEDRKVIVVETILPVFPETANATTVGIFQVDCLMLAHCTGGKERTYGDFEALAMAMRAGFAGFRVVPRAYNNWVMEFCKKM
ncbi:hypothetical protein GIB67_034620 [Kingdonia uniflora]|uniref:O-methyltransferase C-terminal domain-containing protein n=1 Tax=Kingdonia uniflora TaxID=39325 RepID=A0A7J7MYA2_9MAGN|nr:hypothetical protein GIB67_034620 [Kingdonia uniflora]